MKKLLLPVLMISMAFGGCSNKDEPAPPSPSAPSNTTPVATKAGVLFWTSNSLELAQCGAFTVQLNTGQQSNIVGFYPLAPGNCLNQVGGYFYIDAGTYTYTVTTAGGCSISGGTVTVIGGQCNLFRIL